MAEVFDLFLPAQENGTHHNINKVIFRILYQNFDPRIYPTLTLTLTQPNPNPAPNSLLVYFKSPLTSWKEELECGPFESGPKIWRLWT